MPRGQTPAVVVQEIYGLLLGRFIVRKLASEAAATIACPPREISFVNTLKILRCSPSEAQRNHASLARWYTMLVAEVAAQRLPPFRDRVNPRVIKRKTSNWPKKTEKHRNSPEPTKSFRQSIVMLDRTVLGLSWRIHLSNEKPAVAQWARLPPRSTWRAW